MRGSSNPYKQKENVRYIFSWGNGEPYAWLTPSTFTVRGVVHLWEALHPGCSCKVFPTHERKQRCHMDSRVVDIQHVFIAVHKKLHVEVGIQTDLGNCKALPLLDFCALLVDGQAKDDSCAAESESSLTI